MDYAVEEIKPKHDAKVGQIIQQVGAEFGAVGEGFGPSDPEVSAMSAHYMEATSSQYLVATVNGEIVGGSGVAGFNGSTEICELRKLFLLPKARGLGLGKSLTEKCLAFARAQGYKKCYLDTLKSMTAAVALYEKLGFTHLQQPLAGTIHTACDVWMIKEL